MAVVEIINKQSSKDKIIMRLVRRLVIAALTHNILFKAKHIAGKSNCIADHLSRFKFQEARAIAPWLDVGQQQCLHKRFTSNFSNTAIVMRSSLSFNKKSIFAKLESTVRVLLLIQVNIQLPLFTNTDMQFCKSLVLVKP